MNAEALMAVCELEFDKLTRLLGNRLLRRVSREVYGVLHFAWYRLPTAGISGSSSQTGVLALGSAQLVLFTKASY